MAKNKFELKSFLKDIEKDLDKAEKKQIRKATGVLKRKVRSNIKALGLVKTGNLLKGVKDDIYKHTALVGMAPPAFHGLMVELGAAHSKPKPYFLPAFQETKEKIQDVLSEEWL